MHYNDQFADILSVPPEHDAIDRELLNWASWVANRGSTARVSPMFRMFRSNMARGGYGDLTLAPPAEAPRALAVEHSIRLVPELHCALLRGWYVGRMPPIVLCRRLAIAPRELKQALHDARSMLANVMRQSSQQENPRRLVNA